jgi:hypothetical protein
MKTTSRIIGLGLTALCFALQRGAAQPTVQAGVFNTPPGSSIISVSARPSAALNGIFSAVNVTVRWLTSYNITLTLVSTNFSIAPQGAVGTNGPYSFQTFGGIPNVTISWATNSKNVLLTARADGNPDVGTFELVNTFGPATVWYFEFGGADITNNATPFFAQSVCCVRLPVQLSRFVAAVVNQRHVRLDWTTISEVNNYGFSVERRRDSSFTEIPNSFVPGHGTTNERHDYTFTDESPGAPTVWYRLRQVDLDGTVHYTEPIQASGILTSVEQRELAPIEFSLKQNYPNPFNPSTQIKFSVEKTDRATLELYNIAGQKVATLFDGTAEAGQYYRVLIDGANLASGVYFYRLMGNGKIAQKKITLVK